MNHHSSKRAFLATSAILWVVAAALFIFSLNGCSSNSTIGNGQLDVPASINLGDGKLFGSEAAYQIGVSLAQVALFEKPALAHSAVTKLQNVKSKVVDLEEKYTVNQAADIVGNMLLTECGVYCQTVVGQQYVAKVKVQLDAMRALQPNDVTVTLQEFLDQLLAQIEIVRLNPIGESDGTGL
jgi:hypothetical protein